MRAIVLSLLAVAALANPAWAQQRDPDTLPQASDDEQSDAEIARSLYRSGKEAFARGDFDLAIERYRAAHAVQPAPAMLFNIGLAHHRAGRVRQALQFYEQYLELESEGPIADEARGYVTAIRESLAASESTTDADGTESDPPPPPRTEPMATATREAPAADGGSSTWTYIGYSLAGLGAISLVVASKYAWDARSEERELSSWEGPWPAELDRRIRRGERASRRSFIFGGVGGTLVVAGSAILVWQWLRDEPGAGDLEVAVGAAEGHSAVVVGGVF